MMALMKAGNDVTGSLYEAGYVSPSRLYECANAAMGMTPGTYLRAGCGATIRYAIADSPIGKVLVASTERCVCAVSIGDSGSALESELVKEYAAAEIRMDDSGLHRHITVLLRYLQGTDLSLNLPLDIRVTAFQAKVYDSLRKIPCGQKRTYAEIAAAVDLPHAIRAVGRACATNPIALAIPCHRVVRKDGTLGGYRWGVHRKKKLLENEIAFAVRRVRKKHSSGLDDHSRAADFFG